MPSSPAVSGGRAWITAGALLLLVQVGIMLAAFLPVPHSGGDNAGYLGLAHSLLERGAYLDLYLPGEPIHTKYPPGFPLLLAGVRLLGGESWVAFKAAVAATASLAVLFTFLWARERRGTLFGVGVAGLLAVSSALVYYSHWILSDVPFLALTFLSLWSLERTVRPRIPEDREDGDDRLRTDRLHRGWLILACGAAVGAYFTRSAGLPLVMAVAGVLALRKAWKPLAAFAVAFAVPAFAWWLRNRGAPDTYLAEFWLVDPYQPDLGRVGVAGLAGRMLANSWGYVGSHVPAGLTGLEGFPSAALGILVVGLALFGWGGRIGKGRVAIGAAEIFFPLYAGLILLWPEVWSGDRFALPLLPLLLFYAGDAIPALARRLHPRAAVLALVAGLLVVGGPALATWIGEARSASSCMSLTRSRGTWACAGPGMSDFARAAAWSGTALSPESVVISRKPRIFFVLSGLKSQMFPLSEDPEEFFRESERLGARYVLLDQLDGLAVYYVGGAIRANPESFCPVRGFGTPAEPGSQLLGVLVPGEAATGEVEGPEGPGPEGSGPEEPGSPDGPGAAGDGGGIRLSECPPALLPGAVAESRSGGSRGEAAADYSSVIPLFGRSES